MLPISPLMWPALKISRVALLKIINARASEEQEDFDVYAS